MPSDIITARHKSGMSFSTDIDGHVVTIDTKAPDGTPGSGPRPKALMLVSLAGCTGVDIVEILNKMRVKFSDLSITVDGELTDVIPRTYHTVIISYSIKVKKEDEPKVQKAVLLSQDKYCGVSAMFRAFSTVKTKIKFL